MSLIAAVRERGNNGDLQEILIALLVAGLIGAVVYVVVFYGFKQAWGALAGALTFLVVLLLFLVDGGAL